MVMLHCGIHQLQQPSMVMSATFIEDHVALQQQITWLCRIAMFVNVHGASRHPKMALSHCDANESLRCINTFLTIMSYCNVRC